MQGLPGGKRMSTCKNYVILRKSNQELVSRGTYLLDENNVPLELELDDRENKYFTDSHDLIIKVESSDDKVYLVLRNNQIIAQGGNKDVAYTAAFNVIKAKLNKNDERIVLTKKILNEECRIVLEVK